jgi:hypothetical protein
VDDHKIILEYEKKIRSAERLIKRARGIFLGHNELYPVELAWLKSVRNYFNKEEKKSGSSSKI